MPLYYHYDGGDTPIYIYDDVPIQPNDDDNPIVAKLPIRVNGETKYIGLARGDHPFTTEVRVRYNGQDLYMVQYANFNRKSAATGDN